MKSIRNLNQGAKPLFTLLYIGKKLCGDETNYYVFICRNIHTIFGVSDDVNYLHLYVKSIFYTVTRWNESTCLLYNVYENMQVSMKNIKVYE